MRCRDLSRRRRVPRLQLRVLPEREHLPLERRRRRGADQRPLPRGSRALPGPGRDDELGTLPGRQVRAEHRTLDRPVRVQQQHLQRRAGVVVVRLGGGEHVQRREVGVREQVVDGRRVGVGVHAPEQPALVRQRFQAELIGDLPRAHHPGTAAMPASTTRSWPVTQRAIGEARNTHASPTASGTISSASGAPPCQRATPSGHSSAMPGRATSPGETLLTRIRGPYSTAAARAQHHGGSLRGGVVDVAAGRSGALDGRDERDRAAVGQHGRGGLESGERAGRVGVEHGPPRRDGHARQVRDRLDPGRRDDGIEATEAVATAARRARRRHRDR